MDKRFEEAGRDAARKLRLSPGTTRKFLEVVARVSTLKDWETASDLAQLLSLIEQARLQNLTAAVDKAIGGRLSSKDYLIIQLGWIAQQVGLDSGTRSMLRDSIKRGEITTEAQLLRYFGGDLKQAKQALADTGQTIENNGSSPGAAGAGSIEAINRARDFYWVTINAGGKEVGARSSAPDAVDRMSTGFHQSLKRRRETWIQVRKNNPQEWWPIAGWLCDNPGALRELRKIRLC